MRSVSAKPDVLCIGHAAYDLSVFLGGYPAENSKSETEELLETGGGPAANAAYLLASWGASCAFCGLVGDDYFGHRIRAELAEAGTDVALVEVRSGHPTPCSVILVNLRNGTRTLINRKTRQAQVRLAPTALRQMTPRVLLFDGHELDAALQALDCHPKAVSILDAGSWREGTARLAGKVDYLVASEKFGLQACRTKSLAGQKARKLAVKQLRERYGNIIVITLGEQGLIGDAGAGYFGLPAFKNKVVDTTGAGDIFHGAFAYAVLRQMGLNAALRLASMAASLSVGRKGGRPSIPSLEAVNRALGRGIKGRPRA